jgi:hypothetical protein
VRALDLIRRQMERATSRDDAHPLTAWLSMFGSSNSRRRERSCH